MERVRARLRAKMLRVSLSVLIAVAAIASASVPAAGDVRDRADQEWVGAWSTSPLRPDPTGTTPAAALSRSGFNNQTLRQVVYPHFSGNQVRIRLANTFGSQEVTFNAAHIAQQSSGAAIVPDTNRRLTFGGADQITIPVGAQVYSDPVALRVRATQPLSISLYVAGASGPATWHATARQTLYVASGNQAAQVSGAAFETLTTVPSWYWLTGVEVAATSQDGAIVTLGDSITDGTNSTQDANNRWPDYLARRLLSRPANRLSVLNQGIAGNRVLTDRPVDQNAPARLDRDVLTQDGVRYVTLLEGINDIGQACLGNVQASAEQIIAVYKQLIAQVHLKELKIFGATLTPFKGATPTNSGYYCEAGEAKRQTVNTWIRTSGEFDGVIDFDHATRDPADPLQFRPAYDSGDHLHPNDAGYQAMAQAIDLALFRN
jgi:lysophospholipase L1-like esterase